MAGTINLELAGHSRKTILLLWLGVVIASAASAALGYLIVQTNPTADGRYAEAFAAGALLTMLADAMMPEAFMHGGKTVGILTVTGFLVAAILSALERVKGNEAIAAPGSQGEIQYRTCYAGNLAEKIKYCHGAAGSLATHY